MLQNIKYYSNIFFIDIYNEIKNMENKLINELYRINQLMGVDDVIVENVATPIFNAEKKYLLTYLMM